MKKAELKKIFRQFEDLNVLVVGDVMLDAYLWGEVERISPESPVPVVDVEREEYRLGGAGNVGLNINAMGANAILFAAIGEDATAHQLKEIMQQMGMTTVGMIETPDRVTTTKTRVLGRNQQMLRIDRENRVYLKGKAEKDFLAHLENYLLHNPIDVIIMQDYNKGVLTKKVIDRIIALSEELGIPVTVDPKEKNFFQFRGVDLFKPNLKELNDNLHFDVDKNDLEGLQKALTKLHQRMPHKTSLVTLSSNGMALFNGNRLKHFPGHRRSVADVSGAGDTVVSLAALGLGAKLRQDFSIELANIAGGLVCEEVGVVPIDREKLLEEASELM